MKYLNNYVDFVNEKLGVNMDVKDLCDKLFIYIDDDIKNHKIFNELKIANGIGVNKIYINYEYNDSNLFGEVKTIDNNIYIDIYVSNLKYIDLLSLINHEIMHSFGKIKGVIKTDEMNIISNLVTIYNFDYGWIGRLVYMLYFFSKDEMNSNIQEMFSNTNNIKSKIDFIDYIENTNFYKIYKIYEEENIYFIWNKISKDYQKFLLNKLSITDTEKWLSNKDKEIQKNMKTFKSKMLRVYDLLK